MGLTDAVLGALDALPGPLVVLLIAATPVLEVRASIPVGILVYDMPWPYAGFLSLVGNLMVVPVLWWFLPHAERLGRRVGWIKRSLDWVFARSRRQASPKGEQVKAGSIFAIVALPLPGAGTWTAVLAAYVLGMARRRSFVTVLAGAVVEVVIITAVVVTGAKAWQWLVQA